ncbi:MAG: PD-(D/E)XK nuclease family transposase [Lachnospiraceae bacterium]|nr:PD-(D/E)XK nuclease family transposase [Lachnospiraceae bacterium]
MSQEYDDLKFTNDYIFAKVMRNKKLCKQLLEVILDIEIERIEYPEEQKVIDIMTDARSVRLDVYVKDNKSTIYNVEMQTTNPRNLPKRRSVLSGNDRLESD